MDFGTGFGMFSRVSAVSVLVNNDLHYMHFLSRGRDFDKSHNLMEEYYEILEEDVDYLMELSLEKGERILNFSNCLRAVSDYEVENRKSYNYQEVVGAAYVKLSFYVHNLKQLRNSTDSEDVQSKLDDMIRTWEKEINYKLTRRIETDGEFPLLNFKGINFEGGN